VEIRTPSHHPSPEIKISTLFSDWTLKASPG
jgi:hypothetical protein